ncbi:MAG: hypothetical protein IAG13_28520, partial [Deltaproteobacteria bacterium]|nr:hypothetical protein [Nannocystaceae bacterium]
MSNAHTSVGSRVLCCGVLLAACGAPDDRAQPWVTLTSTSSMDGGEASASSNSDS